MQGKGLCGANIERVDFNAMLRYTGPRGCLRYLQIVSSFESVFLPHVGSFHGHRHWGKPSG